MIICGGVSSLWLVILVMFSAVYYIHLLYIGPLFGKTVRANLNGFFCTFYADENSFFHVYILIILLIFVTTLVFWFVHSNLIHLLVFKLKYFVPFSIDGVFTIMTSGNGNMFRVTGPLCGEFSGHRWIPRTKASDAELWCFLWSAPELTVDLTIVRLVIWDAIAMTSSSSW